MAHIHDDLLEWAQWTMAELLSAWTKQHAELKALRLADAKRIVWAVALADWAIDHGRPGIAGEAMKMFPHDLLVEARNLMEELGG